MKNKRGLSTIVATLIIILLVLVAVGIIWVVVRNLVQQGTEQIDISSKCFDTEIRAVKVTNVSNLYTVTVSRGASNQEIGGIKLIFVDSNGESNFVQDVPGDIGALATINVNVTVTGLADPNKVQTVVYFLDEQGEERLCTPLDYSF